MIEVDKALREVLRNIKMLSSEEIKLKDSLERVLARDIYSDCPVPGFDNSAMDGYAVKSIDLKGISKDKPKVLEVIDDIKAGDIPKRILKPNQAIRIMTGALIPKGADSVVMVENTKIKSQTNSKLKTQNSKQQIKDCIEVLKEVKAGENIRRKGEDVRKGERVIQKGTLLESGHIGILASLGRTQVKVIRKPRVAVLATGDEVIDVDEKLEPGKVRSSNSYTLYSQILKCGGIPKNLGIAKDNLLELEKKIKLGFDCDLILTSGGVSVGDYDLVKVILTKIGTSIRFWKVAMRPGKPLVFGMIEGIPVFGLPGNPVSSMVSFEIFVRPAISKMSGQKEYMRKEVNAVLEEDIKKKKGFRYFLRAQTRWENGAYVTRATGPQGSGILKSMALANSLMILPEDAEAIKKGTKVTVRFLN